MEVCELFKETLVTVDDLGCDPISIQTGVVAKQANGVCLIAQGETVVLATVVAAKKPKEGGDFLPLTVDYREQSYAAGRIPGGFFKRQGRPTTKETISCRLIDRPLRPLFPEGFTHELQVQVSVLSYDQKNSPEVLGVTGASAALTLSDIPFGGPVACVRMAAWGAATTQSIQASAATAAVARNASRQPSTAANRDTPKMTKPEPNSIEPPKSPWATPSFRPENKSAM